MQSAYDLIVIGAGNGGLVAAAYAAKAGLKTLVLEKHNLPGGCATSFRRGRFEFESALHELCSVGTEEQPNDVYKIFRELGADPGWCYEHNVFRAIVKGEGGYDVTLKAGLEAFCRSVEAAVPGSYEGLKTFLSLKEKVDAALAAIDRNGGKANPLAMVLFHKDFMRLASHSAEQVMDALQIPKAAQDLVNTYWSYLGVPTDELNALHYLCMLHSYVCDGAAMPRYKSHGLSLALADVILRHGGQILYNSPVTELLQDENGRVTGVCAGGNTFYSREVISNVIPRRVLPMGKKFPARTKKLDAARAIGISFATVYLGLDCTAEELGLRDYTIFITTHENPRKQYDTRAEGSIYILNCLNTVIPDSSPEGTCTLFFTIPMEGADLPKDLTPAAYKAYKNDLARRYIRDAEETLGISIMPHIEQISVATPATFARYLGTPEGGVYGYKMADWDSIVIRIAEESRDFDTPGLTFCGGHHARGDGYSNSYITGRIAAQRVIDRLKGGA